MFAQKLYNLSNDVTNSEISNNTHTHTQSGPKHIALLDGFVIIPKWNGLNTDTHTHDR